METLPLFPLEEFEQEAAQVQEYEAGEGADGVEELAVGRPPAGTGEAGECVDLQGVTGNQEDGPTRTEGVLPGPAERRVYERTGLAGPFPLGALARVFPDCSEELLDSLANDIAVNGLLEEITVAGTPPQIVDGKHRLRACKRAGVSPTFRRLREGLDPRDYVWARNGERRDLTKSQKALAAAELFSFSGPGRPRPGEANSADLQNLPKPTIDRVAGLAGFSPRLLGDAVRVADKSGPASPELREAVREGLATVTGAAQARVLNASQELQRQAVALVRNGEARTVAAAVQKVEEELSVRGPQAVPEPEPPARFGEQAAFHLSSVAGMNVRLEPESVDLIVAYPPGDAVPSVFSDLAALGGRALVPKGLLVVAVAGTGRLPLIVARLGGGGLEWVVELSIVFPTAVAFPDEPQGMGLRRVALLVYGKKGAQPSVDTDIIEVPASLMGVEGQGPGTGDAMALVVRELASRDQVILDPIAGRSNGVAQAALAAGCSFIGADEEQSHLDRVLQQLAKEVSQSAGSM